MVDKVHHGKLKVLSTLPPKRHLIDVAEYKANKVDEQFANTTSEYPDMLDELARQAREATRAGLSDDLDPDQL